MQGALRLIWQVAALETLNLCSLGKMKEQLCVFSIFPRKANYKTNQKSYAEELSEELGGECWIEIKAGICFSGADEPTPQAPAQNNHVYPSTQNSW